jgi:hypothetical protein
MIDLLLFIKNNLTLARKIPLFDKGKAGDLSYSTRNVFTLDSAADLTGKNRAVVVIYDNPDDGTSSATAYFVNFPLGGTVADLAAAFNALNINNYYFYSSGSTIIGFYTPAHIDAYLLTVYNSADAPLALVSAVVDVTNARYILVTVNQSILNFSGLSRNFSLTVNGVPVALNPLALVGEGQPTILRLVKSDNSFFLHGDVIRFSYVPYDTVANGYKVYGDDNNATGVYSDFDVSQLPAINNYLVTNNL